MRAAGQSARSRRTTRLLRALLALPLARSAPLREPLELVSRGGALDATLRVEAARFAIPERGVSFMTRAYNGRVPGPTLRVAPGDAVRLVLDNRLGADARDGGATGARGGGGARANATNVHVHGVYDESADMADMFAGYTLSDNGAVDHSSGGEVVVAAGLGSAASGGELLVLGGYGLKTSSGSVTVKSVNAGESGVSGELTFSSGTTSNGNSGYIAIGTGASTAGKGGAVDVRVGADSLESAVTRSSCRGRRWEPASRADV